ncbi:hypothetical protein R1T08_36585 [Streptomyces sp. SBC-4]|nr:hypothetical protein [Streptomyces sp. SBC-4]MDV5149490.1 hypothetical protein [Streptomyces sp. SBC-4]
MAGRRRSSQALAAGAVLGVAGAGAAALAGASSWAAPALGAVIGALAWGTHTAADRLGRTRSPAPSAATDEPSPAGDGTVPADVRPWLTRASEAAARLDRHRRHSTDPTLGETLANASDRIRSAVDQLRARADAVGVIDATTAGTDLTALRVDEQRRRKHATALAPGPVREAKLASARAVAERLASLERLADLRALMTATVEATALRLEAAAERGSMLISLRAADEAGTRPLDLTALGDELEAVQAGLDKLDEITRTLHDGDAR